jgi:hypothetical protein
MTAVAAANLALRFLLELGALGAIGWWGTRIRGTLPAKVALGTALPLVAAVVWGAFVAPKASVDAPAAARLGLQVAVFGAATVGLLAIGRTGLAAGFATVVLANAALLVALGQ